MLLGRDLTDGYDGTTSDIANSAEQANIDELLYLYQREKNRPMVCCRPLICPLIAVTAKYC